MAWNRSVEANTGKNRAKKSHLAHGIVASVLIVSLATVTAVLLIRPSAQPAGPLPKHKPVDADKRSQASLKGVETSRVKKTTTAPVPSESAPETPAEEEKKPGVFAPGMLRLPNGFELRFKLPAEGETRQLLAGGEIWEVDSKGEIKNITPPPIFEKPFEGMLSGLFERDGMVLPFALKQYSEKEIRQMCKEPTLSYDDDTPEITAKRENVAMLKKGILDFLDAGGKFEDFVDDMQQHSQKAQCAQIKGFHDIRELLASGKGQEAVQYYRAYSQEMSEKGYGDLRLPPSVKRALEEEMKK